jgi:hypothetical protein
MPIMTMKYQSIVENQMNLVQHFGLKENNSFSTTIDIEDVIYSIYPYKYIRNDRFYDFILLLERDTMKICSTGIYRYYS